MTILVNAQRTWDQPRPRYPGLVRKLRSSSQMTKPYWSAGEKTASVTAAIARGAIQRNGESSVVARDSLSIALPL